ncbi:hypothetical protein HYH02_000094 [Chlamydomonas schloesseri]|uniref:Uncharacterized protein n=1 Tax=Chlamydomonas schloesseri TaxID=2026947 RepID=A0A836B7Q5_9CHLO|nr:hypothetical protein HYH02_000094 [Chlamydomonas schloesseri]|eukprot:KAG2449990.1 hypothetical protein HYH02_000094 [Chlamydomonas schloesseri]
MSRASVSLPDLLQALPADARDTIFGTTTFSARGLARCRLACKELRDLCDGAVSEARLRISASTVAEWGPGQRSVLARFPSCTRLHLHIACDAANKLAGLALIGASPTCKQRITKVTLTSSLDYSDRLRPAQVRVDVESAISALARHLPSLQDLQLDCPDVLPAASSSYVARQVRIFAAIGRSLPRLRRLALPLIDVGDLTGIAALGAGCPRLQELTILGSANKIGRNGGINWEEYPLRLKPGSVEGLSRLGALQQLTLTCCDWVDEDTTLATLPRLLGSQRPPALRGLQFVSPTGRNEPLFTFEFGEGLAGPKPARQRRQAAGAAAAAAAGPAAGSAASTAAGRAAAGAAAAAAAGTGGRGGRGDDSDSRRGWGIVRVAMGEPVSDRPMLSFLYHLARVLVEAADSIAQRTIPHVLVPELVLTDTDLSDVAAFSPALRALRARCGWLEVQDLPMVEVGSDWPGDPEVAVAVAAVLGMPACTELRHGRLWFGGGEAAGSAAAAAGSGGSDGSDDDASPGVDAGTVAVGCAHEEGLRQHPRAHEAELGAEPDLDLDLLTATPAQVLHAALDRMWAEAVRLGPPQTADEPPPPPPSPRQQQVFKLQPHSPGAAGSGGSGSGSRSGDAAGGGAPAAEQVAAGAAAGSNWIMVRVRGGCSLPPAPRHERGSWDSKPWDDWLDAALRAIFAAYRQQEPSQQQPDGSQQPAGGGVEVGTGADPANAHGGALPGGAAGVAAVPVLLPDAAAAAAAGCGGGLAQAARECVEPDYQAHACAPAAGALLLTCRNSAAAARLVAALRAAAAAAAARPGDPAAPVAPVCKVDGASGSLAAGPAAPAAAAGLEVAVLAGPVVTEPQPMFVPDVSESFSHAVLQVLKELWAHRGTAGRGAAGGSSDDAASGSNDAAAAAAGQARTPEQQQGDEQRELVAFSQLLELDAYVEELWGAATWPCAEAAPGAGDGATAADKAAAADAGGSGSGAGEVAASSGEDDEEDEDDDEGGDEAERQHGAHGNAAGRESSPYWHTDEGWDEDEEWSDDGDGYLTALYYGG